MVIFIRKELNAFLLILVVLLVPINSFARDVTSVVVQGTCTQQFVSTGCSTDDSEKQSDHCPGNNAADHCDSIDSCPDAAEQPILCVLRVSIPERQLSLSLNNGPLPEVYLAIFVPPESRTLSNQL
jgi:hypothetical protein